MLWHRWDEVFHWEADLHPAFCQEKMPAFTAFTTHESHMDSPNLGPNSSLLCWTMQRWKNMCSSGCGYRSRNYVKLVWDGLGFTVLSAFQAQFQSQSALQKCQCCMCCLSFEKNSFKLGGIETSAPALTKNISVISIWQGLVSWLTTWNQYPFRPPVRPVTPLCSTMSKAAATSCPITCRVLVSLAQDSDYCNPNLLSQNTRLPHSSQHLAEHKNPPIPQIPAFTCK